MLCVCAAAVGSLGAQNVQECHALYRHGDLAGARKCFAQLAASPDQYIRAEGLWGVGDYQGANAAFRAAVAAHPKNAEYRIRWGRLFLEHYQPMDAAQLFQEALGIEKDNPQAVLGMALAAAGDYDKKAVEFAEKAVELDPKLAEAHELLARLALEDNNRSMAVDESDKALKISDQALDAMAVRASMDWLDDKPSTPWMDRILKIDPAYGEAYAMAGHFLVLNRRYEDGIKFYRKALELNPDLWAARAELGVNLMRLGEAAEARQQLEDCYNHSYRSPEISNSLKLLDSYRNFDTFKTPTTTLVMSKKEADLLRPYFQEELSRALATYEKKYHYHLTHPVQVEVYPNHEDFAVRTMGLPGLGALGVTFGYVVAMDSPSSRRPGSFHWASTMWHELSHVYVLAMTNHRVPRWFTEGLAVYEETATAPDWGDRLDPSAISAIKNKKLLPVTDLDRGFIRPSYPDQVVVSYFQAGKICSYIAEKWGYDKLLEMIHSFGELKTTPEVIEQDLGVKPQDFDTQFLAWLTAQTKTTVDGFEKWQQTLRKMHRELADKDYSAAIADGKAIRDIYPDYVEAASVYEALAKAYLATGDKNAALAQLARYSQVGGRNPDTLKQLATLQAERGDKKEAAATLARLLFIYPEDEELHRRLGDLWLGLGNTEGAIGEYRAVLAMKPLDQAGAHFELAKALRAAQRTEEAKNEVLSALEAAPGFKPAQRLLLELDSGKKID